MTARESSAVMAQRKLTKASLDLFPTPPWATRVLCHELLERRGFVCGPRAFSAWEPSCGKGHMAIPLAEFFGRVYATDVHDWGYGDRRDLDFTFAAATDAPGPVDWVIGNPPFKSAELFLDKGLQVARCGVALLLRLQFMEGAGRFERIFAGDRRPAVVAPFAERVAMIEGAWDPEASSATAYAWFIWTVKPVAETVIATIAPGCAQRYTRVQDMVLATPGEAARRKAARKAAELAERDGMPEPHPRLV